MAPCGTFFIIFYFSFLPLFLNFQTFAAVYPSGCLSVYPPFFPPRKSEKFSNTGERIHEEVKAHCERVK